MPAHLGYILNEIPKWFSKSGVRHDAYKELFETFEGCTVEDSTRDVTRMLIGGGGGVNIHIFMFCPINFFSNQIQIDQFEKKLVGQNMNI